VNNGAKINSYTATCKSSNGGAVATGSRSNGPIGVTGATTGKSYQCTVVATNSRGTGPKSIDSMPPVVA
jgi:hypothetical protein